MKSTLRISDHKGRLILRRRAHFGVTVGCVLILAFLICAPFMESAWDSAPIAWGILWTASLAADALVFVLNFFRRIVIIKDACEVHIFDPNRTVISFSEIDALKAYANEGDGEGNGKFALIIVLKDGGRSHFDTSSKEQADELAEIINSFIK